MSNDKCSSLAVETKVGTITTSKRSWTRTLNGLLATTAQMLRKELKKEEIWLSEQLLEEHEIDVIQEAFRRHLKGCSFFPTPAEIVSNCAFVEMLTHEVEGDFSAVGTIASSERGWIGTHKVIAVTMESGDEFFFEPTDYGSETTARKLCVGAKVEVRYGLRRRPRGFDPPPAGKIIRQCRSLEIGDPKQWCGFLRYTSEWKHALKVSCESLDCLCLDPDLQTTLKRACETRGFVRFVYQRQDLGDGGLTRDGWTYVITSIVSMEPVALVTGHVQKTTIAMSPQGRQQVLVEMEDSRTLVCREGLFEECEQLQDTEGRTIRVSVAGELIVDILSLQDPLSKRWQPIFRSHRTLGQ